MPEEKWTVSRLLAWTRDFFKQKGIEKPQLESEILLAHSMQIRRIDLYAQYETEPTETQRGMYREFVKRRGSGEPVAYLVGSKEFYSLAFTVNPHVLIPRPETEDIVLQTLDKLAAYPTGSEPVIADVGTGSGIIAITLAKHLPKNVPAAKIIAVDLSPEALTVAEQNAAAIGVAEKIAFRQSDLLENVAEPLDIVVSNPPYVSRAEYEALPKDVKDFEPKSALLAGETGTEIAQRLIAQSAEKLKPGGYLLIEGSPMIAEKIKSLLADWNEAQIIPDLAGRQRIICARKAESKRT